jgi:hypothetical protein
MPKCNASTFILTFGAGLLSMHTHRSSPVTMEPTNTLVPPLHRLTLMMWVPPCVLDHRSMLAEKYCCCSSHSSTLARTALYAFTSRPFANW